VAKEPKVLKEVLEMVVGKGLKVHKVE